VDLDAPSAPPGSALLAGAAWRAFCARLAALGERILGPDFPQDARSRAEGFRSLTRLLVCATQMEMEAGDPRHPVLYRYEDPRTPWGGPNPDNVYLRATIDPRESYRVWGDVAGVRQALFSLHEGDMQLEEYGVFGERSLDALELAPGGRLELVLSPEPQPGNWIPMHPRARLFLIRVYVADWERDAAPGFQIARMGGEGVPPPPVDPAAVERALERAATWVERSALYWNAYMRRAAGRAAPNVAAPPRAAPGGAESILYGSCFWDLAPDEALLLACEAPDADYFGFTIHTLAWFESGDFAERQTSLNGEQLHRDGDGRIRLVLAHRDPGVPNWIDTEERPRGMLAYRFVRARSAPAPAARVVPVDALARELPADHPRVSPAERRAALARRRAALWSRYR
jgi:hypothetical protein